MFDVIETVIYSTAALIAGLVVAQIIKDKFMK